MDRDLLIGFIFGCILIGIGLYYSEGSTKEESVEAKVRKESSKKANTDAKWGDFETCYRGVVYLKHSNSVTTVLKYNGKPATVKLSGEKCQSAPLSIN